MRGPSRKPSVCAVGASFACATSSSAAMPARSRRAITFSPCATSARLRPVSGITSQTVASATRSSRASGRARAGCANKPRRRSSRSVADGGEEGHARRAEHAAGPLSQSSRLGFTAARTRRHRALGLVVVEDDDVGAALRGGQRLGRGDAAIDADDQRRAALAQRRGSPPRWGRSLPSGGRARSGVTLAAELAQEAAPSARRNRRRPRRSRRTPRRVRRAAPASARRAAATSMSRSAGRVGHQRAQRGLEEMRRVLDPDAARGEQPADDLRQRRGAARCRGRCAPRPARQIQRRPVTDCARRRGPASAGGASVKRRAHQATKALGFSAKLWWPST